MILLDTAVLVAFLESGHPLHVAVKAKVESLIESRARIAVAPQCLFEAYVVLTRPVAVRGFGFSPEQACTEILNWTILFEFIPDPDTLFSDWAGIVERYRVSGKPAHDARLVAWMHGHGCTQLFTLNEADFLRYNDRITLVGL